MNCPYTGCGQAFSATANDALARGLTKRCSGCLNYTYPCASCGVLVVQGGWALTLSSHSGAILCVACAPRTVQCGCSKKGLLSTSPHMASAKDYLFRQHEGVTYCRTCWDTRTARCLTCNGAGPLMPLADRGGKIGYVCQKNKACLRAQMKCLNCSYWALDEKGWVEQGPPANAHETTSWLNEQGAVETGPVSAQPRAWRTGICPHCTEIVKFCTACKYTLIAIGTSRCAACSPVGQYHDKAESKLGFFGHPASHDVRGACKLGCTCTGWDRLYYGVELEVEGVVGEARDDAAEMTKKLMGGKAIVKRDGSLAGHGDAGFEIVTAPLTLAVQREAWTPFFDWAPTSGLKAQKTTTCGMHVHVSRREMSWLQIGKIVQFVHEPENRDFIEFMSGRPPGHYQDFLRDKRLYVPVETAVSWVKIAPESTQVGPAKLYRAANVKPRVLYSPRRDARSRYTAVNLQNGHTIEFRMFKATLNQATFWARLEFCAALVKFTRTGVSSVRDMHTACFATWLDGQRKEYKYLVEHMEKGGYMAPRKPLTPAPVPVYTPVTVPNKKRKSVRARRKS